MSLYQLTLFYPNLRDHASTVRNIREDVTTIAGKNWRVLSAGEQVCAIVFETSEEHERLQNLFQQHGSEYFLFLLTEISSVVGGYLEAETWRWIASRRACN